MKRGLVLGKFLPYHVGHQRLIEFASTHCEELIVLICASNKEVISGNLRKNWLQHAFKNYSKIQIRLFEYLESDLPNTSVSSRDVSQIWAETLKQILPNIAIIFSSEVYGEYLAEYMNATHQPFDYQRNTVNISATQIREDPFKYWNFLPDVVKPYYVKKVVLLGTESTGKSTITAQLARHYKTNFVAELGRELIPQTRACQVSDLHLVLEAHANEINKQLQHANKLLFIDTDMHITQSYAKFLFDTVLPIPDWVKKANQATLYLFSNNDAPYIQDGTRLAKKERNLLQQSHIETLKTANIQLKILSGNWNDRIDKAIEYTNQLL